MGVSFTITTDSTFGKYKANIIEKMKNHENETSFQIGSKVYKQSEWEKMLDTLDKAEESVVRSTEEFEKVLEAKKGEFQS